MFKFNKEAILELLKSMGRFLWFGFLGLVVTALTFVATSGAVTEVTVDVAGLTVNLGTMIGGLVALAAKAVDRYIHANSDTDKNGIAPKFLQD